MYILNIYKEISKFNSKNKWSNRKCANDLHRHFAKDQIQMASKDMKRYSTLLAIADIEIKPQSHILILIRMNKIKEKVIT